MRIRIFANRNLKEITREPLSLAFCLAFPIVLFVLFQIIISGTGANMAEVPQFQLESLFASISIFGFSFLTLFSSMLISKDRETAFQIRLMASPMTAKEFIVGYTLPLLPIALCQVVITLILCVAFGMQISLNVLIAILCLIPSAILFIGFGLLIGTLFKGNSASGISSILINLAAIMGGMFFPLQNMTGAFVVIANILPFAPALAIVRNSLVGNFSNFILPLLTVCFYAIAIFIIAIICFFNKMKKDSN